MLLLLSNGWKELLIHELLIRSLDKGLFLLPMKDGRMQLLRLMKCGIVEESRKETGDLIGLENQPLEIHL